MMKFLLDNWMLVVGLLGVAYSTFDLHVTHYKIKELKSKDKVRGFEIFILMMKYRKLIKHYSKCGSNKLDHNVYDNLYNAATEDTALCLFGGTSKESAYKSFAKLCNYIEEIC